MDEYTELMTRHALMMADWMRRLEGTPPSYHSEGVLLGRRGTLRLVAKDNQSDATLWELSTAPGDTQVRITFPDKTTYLV